MIVIRDVFKCKPGGAKHVVKKFKDAVEAMPEPFTAGAPRIMTDLIAEYWTVVLEWQAESLSDFERVMAERGKSDKAAAAMAGYMDFVEGGYREVFKIE